MATTKNMKKYDSYKLAFERINEAIEAKFPLEAIAIEESIMTDRLVVHLIKAEKIKAEEEKKPNLSILIDMVQKDNFTEKDKELFRDIKQWIDDRNKAIHRIVLSTPEGTPYITAAKFKSSSMKTAKKGKTYARAICAWKSRQDTVLKKLAKKNDRE